MDLFWPDAGHKQAIIDRLEDVPWPSINAARPTKIMGAFPSGQATPLIPSDDLAQASGAGLVHVKDERARLGVGSFKGLGAAYVIARDAETGAAQGRTYVTASAGNHGISLAYGAGRFDAKAVVYIAETVPEAFAERLRSYGARVVRQGAIYEDAMAAAAAAADQHGWSLLSDSSWPGYYEPPYRVMEGYTALMAEIVDQIPQPPTHVFLQAGVGGLAAACAAYGRFAWGGGPKMIVVEPAAAPALHASVRAGDVQITSGPASSMGRLDCKEPSLIALKGLARNADGYLLISEQEGAAGAQTCAHAGLPTTPSGGAGVAGLMAARNALALGPSDRVLVILSEEETG